MKIFILALVLISPQVFAQEDSQIKFRDLEWGASAKVIPGLKQSEQSGDFKCYVKAGEKLKVGDASLSKISYCYYKDKFGSVMIDYEGTSNQIIFKDVLDKKFGLPYRPNQFMENYWWGIGNEVAINMSYSEVSKDGRVIYRYKPVSDLKSQDESASNAEAAKDL